MSETKPISRCSGSKDNVMTGHDDILLDHVIKIEKVEPDSAECDTEVGVEITVKHEQTGNWDSIQDRPNNSTYSDTVDFDDDKKTVALYNDNINFERRILDANVPTDIGRGKKIITQHDTDHSQICQDIQVIKVKSEIETNDETSAIKCEDEITKDLKRIHESEADTGVAYDVYHTETANIKFIQKTDIQQSSPACSLRRDIIEKHRTQIKPYTKNKLKQVTKTYPCDECSFRCENKTTLIRHKKVHSGRGEYLTAHSGEKLFTCNFCDYKSKQKGHMQQHTRTHTGEKSFSCEICNFKCARKETLTIHLRTHTGEKPYSCDVCDFKCKQKGTLNLHMRTHTGEKPFSCDKCDFKCSKKGNLTVHLRTHTGEKPYSCDVCDFKCKQKGNIVKHMRIHTGDKPFSCTICNFKCACKGSLSRHMMTHTDVNPYSCDVCEYKCKRKTYLQQHLRTHTGEKPFYCGLCGYKCAVKGNLSKHMRIHTGE